ncbi:IS3 family transposase [Micromonospora sp. HM134]|uniref:IS3 family transposase n=1 Tax=Micromonospora sp. HM134 TaxID=2583243 RepID=UPI001F11052E|nr:IS3 family transposase [Micromonospora sp. HM134]
MSELAADGIPVAVTCRVLNIARQPYYRWLAQPVGDAELAAAYRTDALFDAHRDDPKFGYRFLADEARAAGQPMVERTRLENLLRHGLVQRVQQAQASGQGRQGRSASARRPGPAGLHRRRPEPVVAGRHTEHRTGEGKLYLCAIKDVWSHRIVGYSIDSRMKSRLAVNALHNAVARRGDVIGCVLHTDRGSQFRSRKFVHALHQHHMTGSMGRVGAAGDNAAMESFFGLLQNNVLDRRTWTTRQQLRTAIVTWIERTYHRRRQRSLSRLTPIEYETIMTPPASQAA